MKRARALSQLKTGADLSESEESRAGGVKTIEDKTFYLKDGFWTDSAYDAARSPKPQEITFASQQYFDMMRKFPGTSKYLAAGRQVILVYKGAVYKIVEPARRW